jgi:hypothetical protein
MEMFEAGTQTGTSGLQREEAHSALWYWKSKATFIKISFSGAGAVAQW